MTKSKVDFDDFTSNYNSLLRESTGFFTKNETYFAKYKVNILRQEVPVATKRLLEYGCGIGRNIPFLRAAFPEAIIVGSDISAASLTIARRENLGIDFFLEQADAVVSDPFEVIFIAGVFHHIPVNERAAVMDTLVARLTPGGTIIIFEHNPFNPVTRKIVNDCPYDRDAVLIRPSQLVSLVGDAGLMHCHSAYCLFVPPSLSMFSSLEAKLGWLPLGGQYWVKAMRST